MVEKTREDAGKHMQRVSYISSPFLVYSDYPADFIEYLNEDGVTLLHSRVGLIHKLRAVKPSDFYALQHA